VDIVFTGLRPGEKIKEELLSAGEDVLRTEHEKIMVLGGAPEADPIAAAGILDALLTELAQSAEAQDASAIRALLARLVPEYAPDPMTELAPEPNLLPQ
jgi:FlaA1/EpsC-like NDP-sugar epimerase